MLRKIICLCLLVACLGSAEAQKPRYRLVWKENFRGKSLDATKWSKIPRGKSDWNRYMSDEPSLYHVGGGKLTLYGVANAGRFPHDKAPYLTGGVYTRDKQTIRYGKVEVKAKLKGARGAWPAIWMLPNDASWPDGGEIDIMERLNHDSIAYQTVHTHYTYVLGLNKEPRNGATGVIDPDGYNVYAVEILPDSLVFSINGKRTFAYPRIETDKPGQYPFGTPFYLLIDMQLEGNWVGKADPAELPASMEVDWVKFHALRDEPR